MSPIVVHMERGGSSRFDGFFMIILRYYLGKCDEGIALLISLDVKDTIQESAKRIASVGSVGPCSKSDRTLKSILPFT